MPDFIMMVGLPASGKSTVAKEYGDRGYVVVSSDAIRAEIKSKKVTDSYIEEKAKQEQQEREAFYQANREKLMQDEPEMDEHEKNAQECKKIQDQIKAAVASADQNTKKELQAKLKAAGLPVQYQKVDDVGTLNKILSIVSA